MIFYVMALVSMICALIWLRHRQSVLLFAGTAFAAVLTLLAGWYEQADGKYLVCFLLILAIWVLAGKEKE